MYASLWGIVLIGGANNPRQMFLRYIRKQKEQTMGIASKQVFLHRSCCSSCLHIDLHCCPDIPTWSKSGGTSESDQDTKDQILSKKDVYLARRTEGRDKGQRQGRKDKGEGEGNKGEGRKGQGRRGGQKKKTKQSLDREEIDMAHRQMVVYKSNGGNPVLE